MSQRDTLRENLQAMNRERESYMELIATLQTENNIARGRCADLDTSLEQATTKAIDLGIELDETKDKLNELIEAASDMAGTFTNALWNGQNNEWDDVLKASEKLTTLLGKDS